MFKTMIVKSIGGGIALAILLLSSTGLKAAVTHSGGSAMQQQQPKTRILSGTVLDAVTNEPVIGAAVQVRGRQGGEITDLDGMFTIEVPSGAVITVTSLGYRSQSLNVGTRDNIRILLEPDSEVLEDVVVTAFGVGQKKESVVGAVQLVRPESLIVPSANLSTAFAGRLAGVVSFQRSGMPGQNGSDFYIRGISTISGVTSPLIILDGVEISAGDLNAIDPEIIEGFSILKDATATAMYGTRGANGVMIITTKSGRDLDRPIIGFRIETNVTTPTRLPKFVDGARYMELFNEAVTNQGTGDVLFSKERIDGTRKRLNPYVYPDVNWYDEIFRNHAFNQKVNFNIRGGTGKITYFMNLTVNHETGMLRDRSKDFFSFSNGINVMKYAFQNNIDFHMSKSSTISLHLNAQVNDITAPAINNNDTSPAGQMNRIYSSIMDCNPVDFPVYFPAGEEKWIKWGAFSGGNDQGATNPLAQATRGYGTSFASTVIANLDFEQKLDVLTKGLRFKAMLSFKNWSKTTTNRSQGVNRYSLEGYTVNPDGTYDLKVAPDRHTGQAGALHQQNNGGRPPDIFPDLLGLEQNLRKALGQRDASVQHGRTVVQQRRRPHQFAAEEKGRLRCQAVLRLRPPLPARVQRRLQRLRELRQRPQVRIFPFSRPGLERQLGKVLGSCQAGHLKTQAQRLLRTCRQRPDRRDAVHLSGGCEP